MRADTAAFVQDLDDLDVEQLGTDARRVGERKLSAFYVDFDGQEPLVPDRVSEAKQPIPIARPVWPSAIYTELCPG